MPLPPDTKLGPYEIVDLVGAGGMGEVYKARDTRLGRTVAIKVLPASMTADPAHRLRVEHEARVVAGLSHPHICALYDIGRDGDIEYFVMEFLEGETLAERLAEGLLPMDLVLRYGTQIAGALAAAHRQGFVHRDLKPSNIMLTRAGAKLLDFGLAEIRAESTGLPGAGPASEATTTETTTVLQMVPGTLLYMAPEQLRGRVGDHRADIFALGAVLYKMVTGRHPFESENQLTLAAAILGNDPPPFATALPRSRQVPPSLEHLIRTCLAKDPDERWQTAQDVARELAAIAEGRAPGARLEPAPRGSGLWWVAAASATAALLGAAWMLGWLRPTVPPAMVPVVRFSVQPPAPAILPVGEVDARLSPDARHLAFVARDRGVSRLFVRSIDAVAPRAIAGSEGASQPFWSPDSRYVGFHAQGALRRVALDGGAIQTLCPVRAIAGATWSTRGVILFSQLSALARVPETGGTPVPVPHQGNDPDAVYIWPQFLPDGAHYVFRSARGPRGEQGLFAASLDEGTVTQVSDSTLNAVVAGRSLLFVRSGTLMAQPFDTARLRVTGEAVVVADQVMENLGELSGPSFSASATGAVAYRARHDVPTSLTWFTRAGQPLQTLSAPPSCRNPETSPDGRRVAVECLEPGTSNRDIWVLDAVPSRPARLTTDAADDSDPAWSPDGRWIVFSRPGDGGRDLYRRQSTGAGGDEPVLRTPRTKYPNHWPDSRLILYTSREPDTGWDIFMLPDSGQPVAIVSTPAAEIEPQLSPNGRWLAYTSDESGRMEVYVRPFNAPGGAWLISTYGGSDPRWRSDGTELYYLASDRALMAVTIGSGARALDASVPRPLFQTRTSGPLGLGVRFNYAVSPRGQRFLITADPPDAAPSPITVVLNWRFPGA